MWIHGIQFTYPPDFTVIKVGDITCFHCIHTKRLRTKLSYLNTEQMACLVLRVTYGFTDVAAKPSVCSERAIATMIQTMRSCLTDILLSGCDVLHTVDDSTDICRIVKNSIHCIYLNFGQRVLIKFYKSQLGGYIETWPYISHAPVGLTLFILQGCSHNP